MRKLATEFDSLVLEFAHEYGWTSRLDVLHAGMPRGTDTASWKARLLYQQTLNASRRNAAKDCGFNNFADVVGTNSLRYRADALPKLKRFIFCPF